VGIAGQNTAQELAQRAAGQSEQAQNFGQENARRSQAMDLYGQNSAREMARRQQGLGEAQFNTGLEAQRRAAGLGEAQFNTGLEDRRRAAGLDETRYNSGLEQNQRQMEMAQRAQNMDQRNQNMRIGDQQFAQQGAMAGLSGQQRQQQIAEINALRNSPMEDYQRFTQGTQVSAPQMPTFQSGTGYQGADVVGAQNTAYQNAMAKYNADAASRSGMMGGLAGLGGSLLTGGTGSFGAQLGTKLLGG